MTAAPTDVARRVVLGGGNADAKRIVVVSILAVGVIAAVGDFGKNQIPKPRLGFAVGIVGIGLAGLAEVAPELAKAFALGLLLTAVFVDGGPAFRSITGAVGTATTSPQYQAAAAAVATQPFSTTTKTPVRGPS